MKKLKKYTWAFALATLIVVLVLAYTSEPGKASNKKIAPNNITAAAAATTENVGGVITLTDNSFNEMIKKGVTLVDFWDTWCRPCRIQAPILDEVSAEMNGKAVIGKLDVDQNPVISGKYFIQSIPTMLLFKDGKVVNTFIGVTSKEVIIAEINKALK